MDGPLHFVAPYFVSQSLKPHNQYYHSVHPPAMSHGITFSCLTSVTKACSTFSMRSMLHSHRVPRSSSSEQSNCSKLEMNPRKITPFKTWNKSQEICHVKLWKTNLIVYHKVPVLSWSDGNPIRPFKTWIKFKQNLLIQTGSTWFHLTKFRPTFIGKCVSTL